MFWYFPTIVMQILKGICESLTVAMAMVYNTAKRPSKMTV